MNESATQLQQTGKRATVPFFKVPHPDRQLAIQKMKEAVKGDRSKLSVEIVREAISSVAQLPTSKISGAPEVVHEVFGPILLIPVENLPHPALASFNQIKQMI